MKNLAKIIAIMIGGLLGWIIIVSLIISAFVVRAAWGMGPLEIVKWSLWERNNCYFPDTTKLVGRWVADDGATIWLNDDGTCMIHDVPKYIYDKIWEKDVPVIPFHSDMTMDADTCALWNFDGYWCVKPKLSDLSKDTIGYNVVLNSKQLFNEEKTKSQGCYTLSLQIHNDKKLFSKELTPTVLYSIVGYLDPIGTYSFRKKE